MRPELNAITLCVIFILNRFWMLSNIVLLFISYLDTSNFKASNIPTPCRKPQIISHFCNVFSCNARVAFLWVKIITRSIFPLLLHHKTSLKWQNSNTRKVIVEKFFFYFLLRTICIQPITPITQAEWGRRKKHTLSKVRNK